MGRVIDAGKALWEAGIDRSKVRSDAAAVNADIAAEGAKGEKAATASATSTLAKVSGLARQSAATVALGAGAMFAAATGLATQGEAAMARYRAETGATQQEAEDALASMNRLSGQNLQSFDQISAAFTAVQTNLGVTGQAAEDATNQILKFSTATGTDAVENVGKFDDILDSWGKTAADLPGIMDQIVASNQKFGGSVSDTEAALAAGAPIVKAYGGSIDDTMAIINLAKASGLDATDVFKGLNAALAKAPPGTTLDQLLGQLTKIDDDGQRAQTAIDLFGQKAGAKLANALHPGINGLGDFKIASQDAAGAATDAASQIENELPNRIHEAVNGALAQARDFATDFGPALMGASSLASVGVSIASALHLDDAIGGALKKAFGSSVVQSAISSIGSGLAGKLSFVVAGGIASGLVFDQVMTAVNKAIGAIPDDIEQAAHEAYLTAQQAGPYVAKAFADTYQAAIDKGLSHQDAYQAALQAEKDALTAAATEWANITQKLIPDPFAHNTSFVKSASAAANEAGAAYHTAFLPWTVLKGDEFEHDTSFKKAGAGAGGTFSTSFADQIAHMSSAIPDAPPRQLGVHFGEQFVVGFKSTRDDAKSEWQQYLDDLAHPNRGQKTVGWVVGKLTGEDLAKGLASSDPVVRHSAEQEQQNLRVILQGLIDEGYPIGKKTLAKLGLGIVDGKLVAITAAQGAKSDVNDKLNNTSGVYGYGEDLVNRWAAGMAHAGINAATIAEGIVHRVGGVFLDDEPIRSDAPEHIRRIGEYGQHFVQRWVGGMWRQGDAAARSAGVLGGRIGDALMGGGYGSLQRLTASGATVRHEFSPLTVKVELAPSTIAGARAQGASWDDIGRMGAAASSAVSEAHLRSIGARRFA